MWLIFGTAIGATILIAVLYGLWGSGTVIAVLPWFTPAVFVIFVLIHLIVAFLAIGRYLVTRQPSSFWIGIAYIALATGTFFFILSFPGLLPDGKAIVASLPNTSSWIGFLAGTAFNTFLLAAIFMRWPARQTLSGFRWLWFVIAWLALFILVDILSAVFERYIPLLISPTGAFTALNQTWNRLYIALQVVTFILALRHYARTRDPIFAYIAINLMITFFASITSLIGGKRYDLWWYMYRALLVAGYLIILFGLLSEHIKLFRQVRESETRYRHLTEYLPQLIWTSTADGQCNYLSPQWIAYTGVPEAPQLGLGWLEQVHPEDRQRMMESWKASVAAGEIYDIDFRIRRNDGAYRWFKTTALPIRNMQGQIDQWFGSCTDIEDQKQAEAKLVAYNVRLERSNQDLQDFAFIASHDLQEPLRKIEYFGDLISRQAENLTQPQKDYFERLTSSASRMRHMVNGLLQVSRLETQAQPFQTVQLQSILNEVISDLETQIRGSNGKVEICDLPAIEADPTQMRQLFQNLITNSIKFQPPGGKPHIKICYTQPTPETVQIQVVDNGIGFDEAHADHLFEPFKRLVGKSEYEGSGIGLALCRKIVERHGGKIAASSQPGQGATFLIDLPIQQQAGFIGLFMEGTEDGKSIAVTGRRRRSG